MKMNVNLKVIIPALIIIAVIAYGAYDMGDIGDEDFLEVEGRTSKGTVIPLTDQVVHATIGESYGIEEIRFTINVKNTGEIPVSITLDSASPTQLSTSLGGATPQQVEPGVTASWTTNWIAVEQFIGTTPSFEVVATATDTLGRSMTKADSISFAIMPDPEIGIDVTISGGGEEGSGADPGEDPETCTDECTFYEQSCVGGDVYNCVVGTDGCKDLLLIEDCSINGCEGGQCMAPPGCTFQTYDVTSSGSCVFDCRDSQEECSIRYSEDAYARGGYITSTVVEGTYVVKRPAYICTITKNYCDIYIKISDNIIT
jgi:hypothetical protein